MDDLERIFEKTINPLDIDCLWGLVAFKDSKKKKNDHAQRDRIKKFLEGVWGDLSSERFLQGR